MKRGLSLFALAVILYAPVRAADAPTFSLARDCKVLSQPAFKSDLLCTVASGNSVTILGPVANTIFTEIEFTNCRGYVLDSCLPKEANLRRRPGSIPKSYNERKRVGVAGHLNYLSGSVPYAATSSGGWAFGLVGEWWVPVTTSFHATLGAGFQNLRISRTLEGTGSLRDPGVDITQSIYYFTVRGLAGLRLPFEGGGDVKRMEWWAEAGGEYLLPFAATQKDTSGESTSFSALDRPLFALLGFSGTHILSPQTGIYCGVFGAYNVFASNGSSLWGIRLNLAVHYAL